MVGNRTARGAPARACFPGLVTVPAPSALTGAAAGDPVAHAQDLQRERCLLFVALTRARDHLYISYTGSPSAFLR
jgi:superfamily I DNA/RNA helicase